MALLSPTHPGFFEVLATRRAYTALLYLLLSLGTGIFAFTFTVTGISLSLGLAILVIGLPVLILFLAGSRLLAVGEVFLLKALVADAALSTPALLPSGSGWPARLRNLAGDPRTWTGLLYFLLRLPVGIAGFTLMTVLLAVGLGLLTVPLAHLLRLGPGFQPELGGLVWAGAHPILTAALCGLAGLALIPVALHLALLLGRFQVWLAGHLLVRA